MKNIRYAQKIPKMFKGRERGGILQVQLLMKKYPLKKEKNCPQG